MKELCRQYSFSDASFYTWQAKFGGMDVSDTKRLKELETKNARLNACWPKPFSMPKHLMWGTA